MNTKQTTQTNNCLLVDGAHCHQFFDANTYDMGSTVIHVFDHGATLLSSSYRKTYFDVLSNVRNDFYAQDLNEPARNTSTFFQTWTLIGNIRQRITKYDLTKTA